MATQLKKTVKPSGGDYTSLEACMNANEQNLVTADKYFDVEIDGSWSSADTSAVTIHNYTTDATRYINIYTTAAARHQGVWSTSKYILAPSTDVTVVDFNSHNVTFNGLQIMPAGASSDLIALYFEKANIVFINNIVDGQGSSHNAGIYDTYGGNKIYRNIFYGLNRDFFGAMRNGSGADNLIYNNTIFGCNIGIRGRASDAVINNAVFNNTTNFYDTVGTTGTGSGYNATNSAAAPGANNQTSKTTANQFVSIVDGSENLLLKTGADCIDTGNNLGAPYNVGITGNTVSGTWDIGADESVSSSPSASPSGSPSASVSNSPSASPSASPSNSPSASPSNSPSNSPSSSVSGSPSASPSSSPSDSPSASPSGSPSNSPSSSPSNSPSASASNSPSNSPSSSVSNSPSNSPSSSPSNSPSSSPSASASNSPSSSPSASPSGAEAPNNTYIVYQNNRLEIWVDGVEVARFNGDGSIDANGAVNANAF